jgi:hypothetical protein
VNAEIVPQVCLVCIDSKDFLQSAVKEGKLEEQQHGFKRLWSHSLPTGFKWSTTRREKGRAFLNPICDPRLFIDCAQADLKEKRRGTSKA